MHPVEKYLRELRQNRSAGVAETSHYGALAGLLNAAGERLRPRVRCVLHPRGTGAGIPDGALFTADQFPRGEGTPLPGVKPERGAVEAKPVADDVRQVVQTEQVARYVAAYDQVLVTTFRDWLLVERGPDGRPRPTERFRMAETEADFWRGAADPRAMTEDVGDRLMEFLQRAMLRKAQITEPKEVAWLLASYARDARFRVERRGELPALAAVREALEDALGVAFRGQHGEHFFRSTLVQTLFYGIFSAWTLWSRNPTGSQFDWKTSLWHLRVPVIGALFAQIATPDRLGPLGLVEVLDWAGDTLNRVVRDEFFARFEEEHAVQYFYEPFLEAFDPDLRKDLGVWYTPPEVVKYMVARVDTVLRDELGIADGLADPRVLVLDPCCGTGAYLVGVLDKIAETLRSRGEDALLGAELKRAATERVFGFEILPAPFVVAHLQLGLLLRRLGVETDTGTGRRVGVFLTNALTGWEPVDEQKHLAFAELEAERDAADSVKRDARILVVIGNPPYNGYPGLAIGEERDLVTAYRETKRAPKPQGQGLNDLYVRFFRMAERRIVEMTGKGIVCFISNYGWLDGQSYTGMRERYLDAFDQIWIDSLNGDKYRTGKLTPDGESDPSVFSTERNREGIQVGTAISLLVRAEPHSGVATLTFRSFWGRAKRRELVDSLDGSFFAPATRFAPVAELGFPFAPRANATGYLDWPLLPQLFPVSIPGVLTARDDVLVDVDREALERRMRFYFDPQVTNDDLLNTHPSFLRETRRFPARETRKQLISRGFLQDRIVRYLYRPFDIRWLYWEPTTKLLDEKRSEYAPHVGPHNVWLSSTKISRKQAFYQPTVTSRTADYNLNEAAAKFFPLYLAPEEHSTSLFDTPEDRTPRPNLSDSAKAYIVEVGGDERELFFHCVAMLHAPAYAIENAGALRQDWPRVPLPADSVHLNASAVMGRQVAALLDPETPVAGVSSGAIRQDLRMFANIARVGGGQLPEEHFALTAGWGHSGKGGAVMPGRGRVVERRYTDEERTAIELGAVEQGIDPAEAVALLGERCFDVYLNNVGYWRCVPVQVWEYTLGGYQVVKKWLSYREEPLLGRALTLDEVREVTGMVRRIAAILLMGPALDGAYAAVKGSTYAWKAPGADAGAAPPPPSPLPTERTDGPTLL